ncbi:MAG: sulfotransferase family protein [Timaviella obliquedivisa GSE-PSE-MK23-08B]|nr:sulfotransferase family protein [Timaviella obliquedivisa GSE-PSE-MK23-08B]
MRAFPSQYTLKENDVFYYIHIPKTAGMTFRTVVADYFHSDEICPATLGHMMAQVNPQDLPKYRLLRGHLVYVDFKTLLPKKNFVHATMLREPVAQLVSHYEYIRRMPTDPDYAKVKEMSLEEFVQYFTIANLRRNTQTYHVAKAARFDIEHLPAQDVFEIALESLDHFAFAGLVERFQDSLFLLSYIFGWRPIMNTRKENASNTQGDPRGICGAARSLHKESYADRLSPATLQLIKENTQLDQQLYDYASQIFSDRFTQMIEDLQQHYPISISTPFTTPSPEALTVQLENHYEQRYRNLNIPTAQTYRYDFSQALRGSGWQRREQPTEGLTYRWTGSDTVSTLDLPIAINQDLILEFRVICTNSIPPDVLNSLIVLVNNTVIPLKILHLDPVMRLFQGTIPRSVCQPSPNQSFTRLTFQVNRVVAFRDPRSTDRRSVGIAINEVQVFPVTMSERTLALQIFNREFWQEPISFLQAHLHPKDAIIAPLSFQVKLSNLIQPNEAIAAQNIQWVVLQKDQTQDIISTLFKLFTQGFHPVFANGLFVIFTTYSQLPKVPYSSIDVKPLYVDILKRNFRKIVAKFTHAS